MDEGSSPSGKDMEWRANAAIGELLAVIRDAKSRDAEVGFKSTMWEAEARTWKERWEKEQQRAQELESELATAREMLLRSRVDNALSPSGRVGRREAGAVPRTMSSVQLPSDSMSGMSDSEGIGGQWEVGAAGGIPPLRRAQRHFAGQNSGTQGQSSPYSPKQANSLLGLRGTAMPSPLKPSASNCSLSSAFVEGSGVTHQAPLTISSLLSMFMAASVMAPKAPASLLMQQLSTQGAIAASECGDSDASSQRPPRRECTVGDDGFAVCHTSVSLEDGDGSSGVGVAAAAAVSAASARAWASAASNYQRRSSHTNVEGVGGSSSSLAGGSAGSLASAMGGDGGKAPVKAKPSKAGFKLTASINRDIGDIARRPMSQVPSSALISSAGSPFSSPSQPKGVQGEMTRPKRSHTNPDALSLDDEPGIVGGDAPKSEAGETTRTSLQERAKSSLPQSNTNGSGWLNAFSNAQKELQTETVFDPMAIQRLDPQNMEPSGLRPSGLPMDPGLDGSVDSTGPPEIPLLPSRVTALASVPLLRSTSRITPGSDSLRSNSFRILGGPSALVEGPPSDRPPPITPTPPPTATISRAQSIENPLRRIHSSAEGVGVIGPSPASPSSRPGTPTNIANGIAGGYVEEPTCHWLQELAPKATTLTLHWLSPPKSVLVVCKLAPKVRPYFISALRWLRTRGLSTYVEPAMWEVVVEEHRHPPVGAAGSGGGGGNGVEGGANSSPWTCVEVEPEEVVVGNGLRCLHIDGVMTWRTAQCGQIPAESACSGGACVPDELAQNLDFVLVLGGDGTLMWTCHIFGNRAVPPLLPFNLGSLGFLTPFAPEQLASCLQNVVQGGFPMILRHRLHCIIVRARSGDAGGGAADTPSTHRLGEDASSLATGAEAKWEDGHCPTEKVVLNEVVIDRGTAPFLTNLEAFCDGNFVTHVQGDGLIVSTPTGSTAYNLAAGGSMVHPQVPGILFTPICPHSLSFRPLVFPDHVQLCIQVPANTRSEMWCSFDGKDRQALHAGDAVIIRTSQWPIPTVCSKDPSRDWFMGVREGLHWNARRVQAGAGQ